MLLENAPKECRSTVRLSSNIYNWYSINFQTARIVLHYLFCNSTIILLLTDTIGIVNNGNILTDGRDERKYLEKKIHWITMFFRFIYASNMIFLLQTSASTANLFPPIIFVKNLIKNELQDHQNTSKMLISRYGGPL